MDEKTPEQKRIEELESALAGLINFVYREYKLGYKQQELYELGYEKVDAELITRHLDSSFRYAYLNADKALRNKA